MELSDTRWGRLAMLLLALAVSAAVAADVAADVPGGDYRLPGSIIPEHYELKMVPYLEEGNMRYTGTVDITFWTTKDSFEFTLHAHKDLEFNTTVDTPDITVRNLDDGKVMRVLTATRSGDDKEFLTITLSQALVVGNDYVLSISFSNKLQRDNYGFYYSSYEVNGRTEYMATTHFEATSARKAFPCFDEPALRATFNISLAKLDDQIALSNMPPISEPSDYDPTIGNRRWVKFEQTPNMPTYLVAFVVSKLKKVNTTDPTINIYVRDGAQDGVKAATEVAPKLLSALHDFVGFTYPLPKLDLVAIPDFPAGAMENWGLITFKEDELLVTEGVSTADRETTSLRVIAHEFAHLWFGDLVTLKWWNTIWQQEGMAAFLESYILDRATNYKYGVMTRFGTTRVHTALESDALEHSPPLTKNDLASPTSIEDHFGTITYSKGCAVHYMLMNVLGQKVYSDALASYMRTNEYSATTIDDFATALQNAVNKQTSSDLDSYAYLRNISLKEIVDSWGNQPGYPVLTLLRDYDTNSATVSQSRFLWHTPSNSSMLPVATWHVPYTVNNDYSSGSTAAFTSILPDSETDETWTFDSWLIDASTFLYLNRAQSGFYRVNYDIRNWLLMSLRTYDLDAATRATNLDDLFALDRVGLVDTWIPLHYMQNALPDSRYHKERDIAPWLAAAKVIRGYAALARADPELSTHFQTFARTLVKSAYAAIGWDGSDVSAYNKYKYGVVRDTITQLACEVGLPECRTDAAKAASLFDWGSIGDPNVLAATLCEGVLYADATKVLDILERAAEIEDLTARSSLLRAAGCTRSAAIRTQLLDESTKEGTGLSTSEVLYLFKSIMDHSPDGCDTVLTYINTNFNALKSRFGQSGVESILLEVAKRIYKDEHLATINALSTASPSDTMSDVAGVAETTRNWVRDNLRLFKEYVSSQVGISPPRPPLYLEPSDVPLSNATDTPLPTEPPAVSSEWLLPADLEPTNYALSVVPYLDPSSFRFTGTVDITFKVLSATDKVVLHAHADLKVDLTGLKDASGKAVATSGTLERDAKREFITLKVTSPLKAGSLYTISLSFSGPLNKDYAGLYLSSYQVGTETKYMAVTQFEHTSARKAFPCFDEPKYRATFDITVARLESQTALSNMKLESTSAKDSSIGNRVRDTFKTTPVMPTYLVAIIVAELKPVAVPEDPRINIWVREGTEDQVEVAKRVAPKVLKTLESLTGIPYPLEKLDLAAIPDFAPGAMENWGLITFKDTVLAVPKTAKAHRRFNSARDVTHEISHLWFGDFVTNNWWSSIWQQEGMASFMEAWVLDQATDSEFDAVARQSVDRIEQGLIDDALETSGPLTNHTVGSPDEITEHAGETTYNKGAAILRMIKAVLGEKTFWRGLRIYLSQHAYSTAGPDDLAAAFQEAADNDKVNVSVPIQDIVDSWTLKKGYPLIDVERYLHDSTYTIKQSRFLSYEPLDAAAAEEQWLVPYACDQLYTTGPKAFTSILDSSSLSVDLPLQTQSEITWMICNAEQAGFYRVNYDILSWIFLSEALGEGYISSSIQRGALVDDALTLMRARRIEPWIALYVTNYAAPGDTSLPVWGAVNKGITYLRGVLVDDVEATADLNTFVRDLTSKTFATIDWYNYWGWEESVQLSEVRDIVTQLACDAGEPLCLLNAKADFNAFEANATQYEIHEENYGAMLCAGISSLSTTLADEKARFQQTTEIGQRQSYAYALGCFTDSSSRNELLQDIISSTTTYQSGEVSLLVSSIIAHGGETEVVTFIADNWAALVKSVGQSSALELLQMVAERVYTAEQYNKISQLVASSTPSIQLTVAERSAAHGLKFAQSELLQAKDFLAVYAGRKPTPPTAEEPVQYRLPGNVVPEHYVLRMDPVLQPGKSSYRGTVTITADVVENTPSIVLHSHKHLDVQPPTVADQDTNKEVAVASTSYNDNSQMYTIHLSETIPAGHKINITLSFSGKLRKDKLGFYLSQYVEDNKFKLIATTQFEQTYARKAFPCFDEPKYRATFDITVSRRTDQVALSNMPEKSTSDPDPDADGRVHVTFETTPKMPTYLVAFIVSELEKVPTSDPNINVYVSKASAPHTGVAVDVAPKILALLAEFTGVEYKLPKLDLVGIPDFEFGAMENWGLVTFRENRLLYVEGSATEEYRMFVAQIIAHEFTHLWFGDLVTLDWWSSGWLKEGMAEFMEYYILESVKPPGGSKWYPMSRLGVDDVYTGMRSDALESQTPLTDNSVLTQSQIATHMDGLTYTKGAALHSMIMGALGVETFRKGLQHYLTKHAYGTATPESYAAAMQDVADDDFSLPYNVSILDLVNSWTTQPGLPVVTLVMDFATSTVNASQSRYLSVVPEHYASRQSSWIVPLAIFFNYGAEPYKYTDALMADEKSAIIQLGGSVTGGVIVGNWLTFGMGYYHTNYDLLNWIRIGSALRAKTIVTDPGNRAGIIQDAFAVARAGLIAPWMPFFVLEEDLGNEASAAPWLAIYDNLRIYEALAKVDPETDRLMQMYLRHFLLELGYEYVGWDNARGDVDGKVARDYASRLACSARYLPCRSKAIENYQKYLEDPMSVDPNVLAATLCEGVSYANTEEVSSLVETLVSTPERSRRMSIIYSLGCTRNATILNTLLEMGAIGDGFEPQEILPLFRSIMDNAADRFDDIITFLHDKFEYMVASLGQSSAEAVVLAAAERVRTSQQYSKLSELVTNSQTSALVDAKNVAERNLEWIREQMPVLRDYLKAKIGEKPTPPAKANVPIEPAKPTGTPVVPTPGVGPTEPPGVADSWRLPAEAVPMHYDLMMVPFLELDNFTFWGKVDITVKVVQDTDRITLHSKDLKIEDLRAAYNGSNGDAEELEDVYSTMDVMRDFLVIHLGTNVTKNTECTISIQFSAPLRTDNFGFYLTSYLNYNQLVYMATTHFEATSARKAFPCFDEPRFRATFDISVARLGIHTALSNMPKLRTDPNPDLALGGRVWDIFETTPSMPTYLVAFMVHELEQVRTSKSNIVVWVRPNAYEQTKVAVQTAPQAIAAMEKFTQVDLPIPKVDLVAIPTFPIGAMENWGLVTFREDYLINPTNAKSEHAFTCANVIMHELSHLWFGDLVTIDWWSSAWLKEGMASFLELFILDKANDGKYSAYDKIIYEHVEPALVIDARESTDILTNRTVGSPEEISDHMGLVTYSKGGSFLRMVMTLVGEPAFTRGLRQYIQNNAYYWATPMDLTNTIEEAFNQLHPSTWTKFSFVDFFNSWTSKPGYPVVTFVRDRENGLATLTQERFLSHQPTDKYTNDATWLVPFNVWVQGKEAPTNYTDFLLESQREKTILLDDTDYKLVLINADQTGFYRVNYDVLTWIYVYLYLPKNAIPSAQQRTALIDDAFALSYAGRTEAWVPLQLVNTVLPDETELGPVRAARDALFKLRSLLTDDAESLDHLETFVRGLLEQSSLDVEWSPEWPTIEKYDDKLTRDAITQLGCTFGDALCLRSAKYDYEAFYWQTATVNPDTLAATLCDGLKEISSYKFSDVWSDFLLIEDPSVRAAYLYGFGCVTSNTRETLIRYATTHKGIKSNEAKIYLTSFLTHYKGGQDKLLEYVEDSFMDIQSSTGTYATSTVLQLLAERVKTERQLKRITALADKFPSIEMTVVKKTAEMSLMWAKESLPVVKDFLAAAAGVVPEPPATPTIPPLPTSPTPGVGWRLPETFAPNDFDLKIVPYLSGAKAGTFDGEVTISVTALKSSQLISLHSVGLKFTEADVNVTSADGKPLELSYLDTTPEYDMVELFMKDRLYMDETYTVHIKYTGTFGDDLKGLYLTSVENSDGKTSKVALTKLAPTYARRVFPCFDEPSFRATFTVTIGRLPTEIALSNTPKESTSAPDASLGGRVLDVFRTTEMIAAHSVTILVADSLSSTQNSDGSIMVYGSDKLVAKAAKTIEAAETVISLLQNVTGTMTGLEELTLVGVKDLVVEGSDNWGIDILREDALVKLDASPSASEADFYWLTSVTHRISQHWFGNLVAMDWWSNVWLTDGFATYFQYKATAQTFNSRYGNVFYPTGFVSRVTTRALAADAIESTTPLNNQRVVGSTQGIERAINDISSLKGGAIIDTLQLVVGEAAFEQGLQNYMKLKLLDGATPDDLYTALDGAAAAANVTLPSNATIGDVFQTWVDRAGYPVVSVMRDYASGTATLSQERFLSNSPSGGADTDGAWWVPVTFGTRFQYEDESYSIPTVKGWIEPNSTLDITLAPSTSAQWLIVNVDRRAFYRVNYDTQNWLLLSLFTKMDGFYVLLNVPTRVMLVDDALALARTGRLDYTLALQYVDYVRQEISSVEVLQAARDALASSVETFVLGTDVESVYKTWVSQLVQAVIRYLSYFPSEEEFLRTGLTRGVVMEWACDVGDESCTVPAQRDYTKWLSDPNSVAHDTLASTVCVGVRTADAAGFESAVANLGMETNDVYRRAIIRGLGCAKNKKILTSLLNMTATEQLRSGEHLEIFKAASRFGPSSVDTALEFLEDNLVNVYKMSGTLASESILSLLADRVTTQDQYDKLKRLVHSLNPNSRDLSAALLLASTNLAWDHKDEVGDVLYALTGVPNPDLPQPPTTPAPVTRPTVTRPPWTKPTQPATKPTTKPVTKPTTKPVTKPTTSEPLTLPTGPSPTDPATRVPSVAPTWFTLPPSEPTSPETLPPLPPRTSTSSGRTTVTAPTKRPTKRPTAAPGPKPSTAATAETTAATTAQPDSAAGVAVNALLLLASVLLLNMQRFL